MTYPSQSREYQRAYYEKNKEKLLKSAQNWRAANKEKLSEIDRQWRLNNPKKYLTLVAKSRALKRDVEFSITEDDFEIPEKCPILGVEFNYGTEYAMSLDRKDNSKGYIPGNVWIISKKANSMKSNATDQELISFGLWVVFNV